METGAGKIKRGLSLLSLGEQRQNHDTTIGTLKHAKMEVMSIYMPDRVLREREEG